ncbi:MAG: sulfotransferase family protein [Verrucomicrobiota bacterium]
MLKAFTLSCRLLLKALVQIPAPEPRSLGRPGPKRMATLFFFVPAFILIQAIHWTGFLLDELFFRNYRKVRIDGPVFITGVPRSGTTLLHRTLSHDKRFTTFLTWELLFGLSITARKIIKGLAVVDRFAGSPLKRLLKTVEKKQTACFNQVHHTSLFQPEEDYLSLCPVMACFILVLPFPRLDLLWKMAYFDKSMPFKEEQTILAFYKSCLKKHIYFHGESKRLLSKNASFSGAITSLAETFPDARIICCTRNPAEAVPSALSSIQSGIKMFGLDHQDSIFKQRIVETMKEYYQNIERVAVSLPPEKCALVDISRISGNLEDTVRNLYQRLGLDLDTDFEQELKLAHKQSRCYQSAHNYSLEKFGIEAEDIRKELRPYWEKSRQEEI